ncbi:MAG TPA: bifunctional adenosylcobinamide kinase/adenosylcobinamide-phosphate guanylyltransferase [Thermoguttaceae bacterium]|nr:bifunctional adenosylcobinamide kinase/adenosylcobinamide-phosphate guanylyltransferase [Thermoguttaceae bacterium]
MAKILLITGGCRSGKSAHAQRLAESIVGRHVYVATCPITDDEMRERVARHQQQRRHHDWETIEEPTDLADAILRTGNRAVVLVDCLTLWVNNLMYEAEKLEKEVEEQEVERLCGQVLDACRRHEGTILFVTNEVGMGIVPDNAISRRYRDLVGRCNQTMAAGADEVTLVASGIPLTLKGENDRVPS